MSIFRAVFEEQDLGQAEAIAAAEPADPMDKFFDRTPRVAPAVTLTQEQEIEIVARCEKRMVSFLQDPEITRRLIRDERLYKSEED
jgi:hypothetical protein